MERSLLHVQANKLWEEKKIKLVQLFKYNPLKKLFIIFIKKKQNILLY